jgi:hypothetical protein
MTHDQLHPLVQKLISNEANPDGFYMKHGRKLTVFLNAYEQFAKEVDDAAEYNNMEWVKQALDKINKKFQDEASNNRTNQKRKGAS